LWLTSTTSARTLLDWARQIDRQALMNKSTKFGIVVTDGPQRQQVEKNLIPELRRLGYTPAHVAVIPNDYAQVPVKTASEVPTMKGKGVTVVLMAADYAVSQGWIRESERNGWKPQYLQSDFPGGAHDYSGGQNSQAGDWSGAIAVSSTREWTAAEFRANPLTKHCLDVYERARGSETPNLLVGWVLNYCDTYRIFELAATRAGTNLTRRGLVQALASLGEFPLAGAFGDVGSFGGPYPFGPVRWSAYTQAQRKVWRKPCPHEDPDTDGCYVPEGPVYRMAA
jgi:ABC-type branched-subunit amino acid transport system substrate-binding protein